MVVVSQKEMTREEIEQFLTCARVGRLGLIAAGKPYVIPLGYAYADGRIFFHTCGEGYKVKALKENPHVCFEVDESLSDASMYKSVVAFGTAEILSDEKMMTPYLQKLIEKYRVPQPFEEYMNKPGRNREKEIKAVRICKIELDRITGRKFSR
jgi:nitroimidazol reductase NimA-like FMN-containing flavoprotein (pyridoxamine 5'-phosphate oxidase superfamily)